LPRESGNAVPWGRRLASTPSTCRRAWRGHAPAPAGPGRRCHSPFCPLSGANSFRPSRSATSSAWLRYLKSWVARTAVPLRNTTSTWNPVARTAAISLAHRTHVPLGNRTASLDAIVLSSLAAVLGVEPGTDLLHRSHQL